jgi:hypothetical protein
MKTFIKPSQDASIYQQYSTLNSGLDEILEVGKVAKSLTATNAYASASARTLLQFDIPSANQYPSTANYYLNLRIANATNINRYQSLEIYPVSKSWIEGSGYFQQDIKNVNDGVTWKNATKTQSWTASGSDYVPSISASYVFSSVPIEDVRINITNLIAPVVSGSNQTPWYGLLIKFPLSDESDSANIGNVKFFSGNTHTIFAPTIEVAWNSQVFITGSLKPISTGNVSIIPKNIKEAYTVGEIDKIYLVVRDKYPDKRFDAVQRYKTTYYLPSESYYRIKDEVSGMTMYDFDSYSAINCDASGSYILLDTSALEVSRYYTIELKVQSNNLVFFPEFNYAFKVDTNG